MMARIEVLVGMIGSGKSMYAHRRADAGALVISHDDLTAMLHARYRYEQGLRQCYRAMEEALAREGIRAGRDVVIDRTHLTRESRGRWILWVRWLRSCAWRSLDETGPPEIVAVAFPILPAEIHARRRFESDPRGRSFEEWYAVALQHAAQAKAEPLELSEGFHRIDAIDGFPHPEGS